MMISGESEQMLTKYLLNEVSEEERERIEEQIFTDRDFFEQVRTAEMRLIDRYVLGEMTADEQERFKSRYLSVPEHRRRVREAKLFHERLQSVRSESARGSNVRRAERNAFFAWASHFGAPAVATASLAAVVVAGTGVWLFKGPRVDLTVGVNANQILAVGAKPSPSPSAVPTSSPTTPAEGPVNAAIPVRRNTPPPASKGSTPDNPDGGFPKLPGAVARYRMSKRSYPKIANLQRREVASQARPVIDFRSRENYSDPGFNFEVKYSGSVKGRGAGGVWLLNVKRGVETVYLVPDVRVDAGDEIALLWMGEHGCTKGNGAPVKFRTERKGGRVVRVVVSFAGLSEGSYLFTVNKVSRCFDLRFTEE